jgi:hypothetical protein
MARSTVRTRISLFFSEREDETLKSHPLLLMTD